MYHRRITIIAAAVILLLAVPSPAQQSERKEGGDDVEAVFLMLEDSRNPEKETFLPLLNHGDAAVRGRACRALGRIGLLDCPDWFRVELEKVLNGDPEPWVRAAAAFALGEAMEGDSAYALIASLRDKAPEVRAAAAEALSKLAAKEAVAPLLHLIAGDPSVEVRRMVLLTAWRIADPRTAETALEIFGRGPRELRWPSAYHLARFPRRRLENPESFPSIPDETLTGMAGDSDPEVRKCAARIIASSKPTPKVSEAVLKSLLAGTDRGVRVQALRAAAVVGGDGLAGAVLPLLKANDHHLRLEAVRAAAGFKGEEAKGALYECLDDPAPAVAGAAVASLASIDPGLSASQFEIFLKDSRPQVRAAAVGALDRAPGDQRWAWFESALADEISSVRIAAAQALGVTEGERAKSRVIELLGDSDTVIRAVAASAVGRTSPAEAVAPLISAYRKSKDDPGLEAGMEILRALAAYGEDGGAKAVLTEALKNPDRSIRILAARLLREADGGDRCGEIGIIGDSPGLDYYREAISSVRRYPAAVISTSRGEITIRFSEEAILTAGNFISLARKNYYDGIVIHRVVPDFVVQAGCPRGDGWGGPGYSIRCEINSHRYERGAVGMALAGKDTGGSQWFITLAPQPHLDGGYTIFAHVTGGMEIADSLMPGDMIVDVKLIEERP